jgi:hypothetical protein
VPTNYLNVLYLPVSHSVLVIYCVYVPKKLLMQNPKTKQKRKSNLSSKSVVKKLLKAGLPDGIFSNQKIPFCVNFGGSCNAT